MRATTSVAFFAVLQASALVAGQDSSSSSSVDYTATLQQISQLAQAALNTTNAQINSTALRARGSSCTLENLTMRREWGTLSENERKAYTDAVLCLQSKPALTPSSVAPGARSRFDDFVATHINQTLEIHYTGNFLSWHRYFIWLYEQALQTECSYIGAQPYWDWPLSAVSGMANSPVWDGSAFSISGNGVFIPDLANITLTGVDGLPPITLPPGTGGGCVTSGPFVNMTVNLGPAALSLPGGATAAVANPLDWNPRCLKRSLTDWISQEYAGPNQTLSLLVEPQDIYDFEMQMQGVPGSGNIGVHGGGHYAMGGDPSRDLYVSPGDPAFYLHHGMIDRVWWIWQMLDPATRVFSPEAVSGTNTFLNVPPSANTTIEDYVNYGYAAGPPLQIKDLLSTVAGPFCYVYL